MHFESNCFIDFQLPIMCFTILDSMQAWCKQVQNPINVSRPCWKFKKVLTGLKLVYLFVFRILYFHFGIVRTPKNIKKVEMEKLLKGKGDPKKGGNSLGKRGMQLIWVFFLSGCGKCDCLTFNYLGRSVLLSTECRCQPQISLFSFTSCLQDVYFLFPYYSC